jgi:hypothetical protein
MPIDENGFHGLWGTGGAAVAPDESGTRVLDPKAFESQWFTEPKSEKKAEPVAAAANPIIEGASNLAGGFGRGVMDVANTGAQGIGFLDRHVQKFLADRGIISHSDAIAAEDRGKKLDERIIQENKTYDEKHGDSWMASGGRIGGQLLASAPLLATGEGALAAGTNALTRASPTIARTAATVGNNLLARMGIVGTTEGALGGAEIAGATSSANPEQPVGSQIAHGATTGAILGPAGPLVQRGAQYAGSAAKALAAPFTESGQAKLATGAINDMSGNRLLQPQTHEIVPGSVPTLAESTGDAGVAALHRQARDLNPAPFVAREEQNAAARTSYLNRVTGTPQDIDAAKATLDKQASTAVQTLFKPGQAADSAPVVAEIDGMLAGPGGKRDAVKTVLTNLRSKLVNKDGSLESNPEVLYNSVRKQIGDMLDKTPSNSPAGQQAERELMQVKNVLDDRITKAVPGFDRYLADYSSAAKPIDAMRYLQGLNLTDSKGNITLAKVDNALKGIQKQRQAEGLNPAKSLDNAHIDALTKIRDDLLRAQNTQVGISKGSPTFQNIATNNALQSVLPGRVGTFAGKVDPRLTGTAAGATIGNFLLPGGTGATVGSVMGGAAGHMAGEIMKGKNAQVMSRVEEMLLNPHSFNPANVFQGGQNLPVNRLLRTIPVAGAAGVNRLTAPALQESN